MRIVSLLFVSAFASAVAFVGCGGDDSGSSSTSSSSTSEFHCCLNGSYYQCPNQAALDNCVNDPSGCTRDSSKDTTCQ